MPSSIITVVGVLAAIVSTISFVPQAWRIVKARDVKSISTGMYSLTVCAFLLWTSYGVLLWNWPLIVPNVLCLVMSAFILTMKLLPAKKRETVAKSLDLQQD